MPVQYNFFPPATGWWVQSMIQTVADIQANFYTFLSVQYRTTERMYGRRSNQEQPKIERTTTHNRTKLEIPDSEVLSMSHTRLVLDTRRPLPGRHAPILQTNKKKTLDKNTNKYNATHHAHPKQNSLTFFPPLLTRYRLQSNRRSAHFGHAFGPGTRDIFSSARQQAGWHRRNCLVWTQNDGSGSV